MGFLKDLRNFELTIQTPTRQPNPIQTLAPIDLSDSSKKSKINTFTYPSDISILCCDDNEMVMMSFRGIKIKKYPNIKKEYATNGLEAIKKFK